MGVWAYPTRQQFNESCQIEVIKLKRNEAKFFTAQYGINMEDLKERLKSTGEGALWLSVILTDRSSTETTKMMDGAVRERCLIEDGAEILTKPKGYSTVKPPSKAVGGGN